MYLMLFTGVATNAAIGVSVIFAAIFVLIVILGATAVIQRSIQSRHLASCLSSLPLMGRFVSIVGSSASLPSFHWDDEFQMEVTSRNRNSSFHTVISSLSEEDGEEECESTFSIPHERLDEDEFSSKRSGEGERGGSEKVIGGDEGGECSGATITDGIELVQVVATVV